MFRRIHVFNIKTFATLATVGLVSACSSPPRDDAPTPGKPAMQAAPAAPGANARDITPVQAGAVDALGDPQGILAKRSIYFDYDSSLLNADGQGVVRSHSDYLNKNRNRRIIIQGNTDQRGGTEYNLALGQKRAEAVRKSLAALGVADSQMEAVSLGENKPRAGGAGEAAWTENRRADIVY
jgi:peptidoglycan-associated lipoprotein